MHVRAVDPRKSWLNYFRNHKNDKAFGIVTKRCYRKDLEKAQMSKLAVFDKRFYIFFVYIIDYYKILPLTKPDLLWLP